MTSDKVEVDNFSYWNLDKSASSNHAINFYVVTENCFLQFMLVYSTMNTWSHSVQGTLRVQMKDGKYSKTTALSPSEFKAEGGSVDAKIMKITQTPESNYELFYQVDGVTLNATVTAEIAPFRIGSGRTNCLNEPDQGFVDVKYLPKASCAFEFQFDGKTISEKGVAFAHNSIQHIPQSIYLWNFVTLQTETDSLFLYQFDLPEKHHSQGCLILDGKMIAILLDNKSIFYDSKVDDFSGHEIPSKLTHEWSGFTLGPNPKPIYIKLALDLSNLLDKVDILAELPYLIRVFVQTFVTAPFCYQWLETATAIVGIDGVEREIKGKAFHENTFLAKIPQSLMEGNESRPLSRHYGHFSTNTSSSSINQIQD